MMRRYRPDDWYDLIMGLLALSIALLLFTASVALISWVLS